QPGSTLFPYTTLFRSNSRLVSETLHRLKSANFDTVADYGELVPFLDTDIKSFFSCVCHTERPDVAASKLLEGRVVVLTEGTPFRSEEHTSELQSRFDL